MAAGHALRAWYPTSAEGAFEVYIAELHGDFPDSEAALAELFSSREDVVERSSGTGSMATGPISKSSPPAAACPSA